jgi:hypothetical protein
VTGDGDLGRVLNALSATLNDQRHDRFDAERVQGIVVGALGGEPLLRAEPDPARMDAGWVVDERDVRVAEVRRHDGRWEVERIELS